MSEPLDARAFIGVRQVRQFDLSIIDLLRISFVAFEKTNNRIFHFKNLYRQDELADYAPGGEIGLGFLFGNSLIPKGKRDTNVTTLVS